MNDFKKNDNAKPMMGLLPPLATIAVAKVLTHGAEKYAAFNWTKASSTLRLMNAALRHCFEWLAGETIDPESGLTHLSEAICSLMFLEELHQAGKDSSIDDRHALSNDVSSALTRLVGGSRAAVSNNSYPLITISGSIGGRAETDDNLSLLGGAVPLEEENIRPKCTICHDQGWVWGYELGIAESFDQYNCPDCNSNNETI